MHIKSILPRPIPPAPACGRNEHPGRRVVLAVLLVAAAQWAAADDQRSVKLTPLDDAAIASYARVPSSTVVEVRAFYEQSLIEPVGFEDLAATPTSARGLPGIVLFDYDGDGDIDAYVTNGPGAPNSLLQNQLRRTGTIGFLEVAAHAGVEATDQDSFGACAGDTDNDGDRDLLVLGRSEPNQFFENNGDGTFSTLDVSGLAGGSLSSTSCSMADFDNDGLLDVVIANTFDQADSFAIFAEPFNFNEHNQLFMNEGGNRFADASAASGITVNGGYPAGAAAVSWGVGSADVDRDGDIDIVFTDDQGVIPAARHEGGLDRAFIHVFINDGSAHFVDQPLALNVYSAAPWMGVSFGDLNCDGNLDFYASCLGDYADASFNIFEFKGGNASRHFLGNGDGTFIDSGSPIPDGAGGYTTDNEATAFGWGNAIFDIDNDGDNDVVYHGGLDANLAVVTDNPGVVLLNQQCSGAFTYDPDSVTADHLRRNVRGIAVGDLDDNGFVDVMSVANLRIPEGIPLIPSPAQYGDPLDASAFFAPLMFPTGTPEEPRFVWGGLEPDVGDLMLELNGGNENRYAKVRLIGSIGLTPDAKVNRDGIGALIRFTPRGGPTTMQSVVAGSSHSSHHALEKVFGLGQAYRGRLDVHWPGGVRNRLYNVLAGSTVMLPEIPCSFDADWSDLSEYLRCVLPALNDLHDEGIITLRFKRRLLRSAVRAFFEGQRG